MIPLILFYFLTIFGFTFLFCRTLTQLGRVSAIIFLGYILINIFFLLQMPFYSDDIYNHSVSNWFMGDFLANTFSSYHYARFPLTMFIVMGTLKYFFSYDSLGHLLLFVTHGISILILGQLFFKFLAMPKYLYLSLLLILFSLNSNVENLLWLAAIHENLSLMFTSVSVLFFTLMWETKDTKKRLLAFSGAFAFQLMSVASSEVGYLLLSLHPIFLFLVSCPKLNLLNFGIFIKRSLVTLPILLLALIFYRVILSSVSQFPFFASPYQVALDPNLLFLFSKNIIVFPSAPLIDSIKERSPLLAISFLVASLITLLTPTLSIALPSKPNLNRARLRLFLLFIVISLFSIVQIFPHAIVATTLRYNFPRFSYLFGIFISFALFTVTTAFLKYCPKRYASPATAVPIFLVTLITGVYTSNWTNNVLLKIPSTKDYITNFEQGLQSGLTNKISSNTLVLFSFTNQSPKKPLIDYIRPYDLLQWNHGIIGYFNSGFIPNLPSHVYPMPLDQQNIADLSTLNLTLTGSYWVKYGNNPQAVLNMIDALSIKHISHYYYTGEKLESQPIDTIHLYNVDYTPTLGELILD